MTRLIYMLVVLLAGDLTAPSALASHEGPTRAPEPPKQVYCPVTPEEEIDPEVFTEFEGRRVYFCCERCRARFLRDPQRYATRLISTGAPIERQSQSPPTPDHQHEPKATGSPPTNPSEPTAANHQHDNTPAVAAGGEHDHQSREHGHGPRWISWVGRFHPAMVNFPLGVIVAGAVGEALFLMTRRQFYSQAARFCVRFGALTGFLAGLLGWCFGGFHIVDSDWLLGVHRWLGTSTVLCLLGLLWVSEQAHREPPPLARRVGLYRVFLFSSAALVSVTGFFGGAMVYGIDHYVRP